MSFNPRLAPYSIVTEVFDADPAADKTYKVFKFPTAGKFLAAIITNDAAVATATNTVAVFIEKYNTGGTTLQGTLASFAAGSTWAADVPRTATVTSFGSTALFAAGEVVSLKYDEATTGLLTDAFFQLDYQLGYDTGEVPTIAAEPS